MIVWVALIIFEAELKLQKIKNWKIKMHFRSTSSVTLKIWIGYIVINTELTLLNSFPRVESTWSLIWSYAGNPDAIQECWEIKSIHISTGNGENQAFNDGSEKTLVVTSLWMRFGIMDSGMGRSSILYSFPERILSLSR